MPVVDYLSEQDIAGGAGNVAANLAALGARVEAFGVVGAAGKRSARLGKAKEDAAGAALRDCLRRAGASDSGIIADPDRVTTLKTRIIARHHQIVRIDHEQRDPVSPATEEKLFRAFLARLKVLDAIVLSDYDKGLLGDSLTERILNAAHQARIPVFVKPKTSRLLAYRGSHAIVCNAKEAGHYAGRTIADEKSLEEVGRALLARFGCTAVITRGEHGMSVFEESAPRHLHIPATRFEVTYARVGRPGIDPGAMGRQVFDVTGAGDTVLSVLALAVAAGASVSDAARLANAAAGVVVGKLGTATLNAEELTAALQDVR